MHELALCEGILDVVLEAAGDRPVRRVSVAIGPHWAVSQESFDQSFRIAAQETGAASAVVEQHAAEGDTLAVDEIELDGGVVLRNPNR